MAFCARDFLQQSLEMTFEQKPNLYGFAAISTVAVKPG